jgi:hypothetical protein
VREVLEAQQCYLVTHFGFEGRDMIGGLLESVLCTTPVDFLSTGARSTKLY